MTIQSDFSEKAEIALKNLKLQKDDFCGENAYMEGAIEACANFIASEEDLARQWLPILLLDVDSLNVTEWRVLQIALEGYQDIIETLREREVSTAIVRFEVWAAALISIANEQHSWESEPENFIQAFHLLTASSASGMWREGAKH